MKEIVSNILGDGLTRDKISVELKARLEFLNYKSNSYYIGDGNYSIYYLDGTASINHPYKYDITFVSDERVEVSDILNTDVKIVLEDLVDFKSSKTIFGKIYKASEDSMVASKYMYKIEVVHPYYYLNFTNKYEIFENSYFFDIINTIIKRYSALLNITLDIKIDKSLFAIKDYTTQYNQSDLEFILMLCEANGVCLVFDSNSNPFKITLCSLNDYSSRQILKTISSYNHINQYQTTNYLEDYYDFNNPSLDYKLNKNSFKSNSNSSSKQLSNDLIYEKFNDKLDLLNESFFEQLNQTANVNSTSNNSKIDTIRAFTNDLNISEAVTTTLIDSKTNKSIQTITLSVNYKLYVANALDEYSILDKPLQYEATIQAVPTTTIYNPPKTIVKPKIYGVQTAIVTSQDVNESPISPLQNSIDVDELGRVRVLFHFERNKTTSCYLRVTNISSGNNYGSMFIPRVNSEVIVSFVNGDPDCPIIIGTLYNGENKIPYPLPANKTKSYIRTYTTPQYENQQGYNEILFDDMQGNEELNIQAQKDMNTLILNDETKIVKHNQTNLIENDRTEDIKNDETKTINNDKVLNVNANYSQNVEKEKITTVTQDYDLYVDKNFNVNVKETLKQIIEQDFVQRVKGNKITYVENDVKLKYLQNLFKQIDKNFKIDVKENFHTIANTIKQEAKVIELIATKGVSIRSGSNVLTVNSSGIYINSKLFDTNSSYSGLKANSVNSPIITKPLFEKVKVKSLSSNIVKQSSINDTVIVEANTLIYKNDTWIEDINLNQSQLNQLQFVVVKNNDKNDNDIVLDEIDNGDDIVINKTQLSLNISKSNLYKYAHIFAFANNSNDEGYILVELKRDVRVVDIALKYITNEEVELKAILNVENPRQDELEQIRWNVENNSISKYNGQQIIRHNIKEENVYEINFNSYIENNQSVEDSARGFAVFDEEKKLYYLGFEDE